MANGKKPGGGGGGNRNFSAGRGGGGRGGGGGGLFSGSAGIFLFLIVIGAMFLSLRSGGSSGSKNGVNLGSPSSVGTVEENISNQHTSSNFFSFSQPQNNPPSTSPNESVYKDTVTLYSSGAMNTNPNQEYVDIYASSINKNKLPVTGWTLQNSKGDTFTISSENGIFLNPGDILHVVTGLSPLGNNFRTNLCTGYFNQYHNFTPSLREECPRPETENGAQNLENSCYDFLKNLPRCRQPLDIAGKVNTICQNYINEELNYSRCVAIHQNDKDFYKNEWYIYLGRPSEVWKSERETITLRDQSGKIVISTTY